MRMPPTPAAPTVVGLPRGRKPRPEAAESAAPPREAVLATRCRRIFRVLALVLCGLHAYVARHTINPDGISYLDVAAAYLRGDTTAALNSYWSPLYSWLLAGVFAVLRPPPYWECAVAHGVNFAVFVAALAAFEWLLSELLATRRAAAAEARDQWQEVLPDWFVVGLAYAVFVFVSRRLVTVSFVTPDMMTAAVVYAASALLLRLRRLGPTAVRSLLFGALLGAGYLAKAVLLPVGLVFLAASLAAAGSLKKAVLHFAWSAVALAAVAGPFLAALSLQAGRPTFGDSGRLNYLWYVRGVPSPHRLGSAAGVHAFARPGGGSYPLWYDPAHWYGADAPAFDVRAQLAALAAPARFCADLLADRMLCFTLAVAVLFGFAFFSHRGPRRAWLAERGRLLAAQYPLLLPAGAALALYLLVGHMEGRLIGPFVVTALLALPEVLRFRQPQLTHVLPLGAALLACVVVPLGVNVAFDARNAAAAARCGEDVTAHPQAAVAADLAAHGLKPGDAVGSIGFTYNAYWARLGGWQVVAEVPAAERFRAADARRQAEMLDDFRRAGARVVVCDQVPDNAPGWRRVAGTTYAVRDLTAPEPPVRLAR